MLSTFFCFFPVDTGGNGRSTSLLCHLVIGFLAAVLAVTWACCLVYTRDKWWFWGSMRRAEMRDFLRRRRRQNLRRRYGRNPPPTALELEMVNV